MKINQFRQRHLLVPNELLEEEDGSMVIKY